MGDAFFGGLLDSRRTMLDIQGSHVLHVDEAVIASPHDSGLVLMHTGNGYLFSANRTGAHIWRCVERRLPVHAIAVEISDAYGIAYETEETHTRRFLSALGAQGLVVPGGRR